jgi:hypothetical protein
MGFAVIELQYKWSRQIGATVSVRVYRVVVLALQKRRPGILGGCYLLL